MAQSSQLNIICCNITENENCSFAAITYVAEVVNVAPGIFSKKVVSDGLILPASSTFSPINSLTTTVHLDKPYSVFVHYQFTVTWTNKDLYSKLLVNDRILDH